MDCRLRLMRCKTLQICASAMCTWLHVHQLQLGKPKKSCPAKAPTLSGSCRGEIQTVICQSSGRAAQETSHLDRAPGKHLQAFA
eukprot:358307-Chlamydomonas_euryale.AAC.5